MVWVGRGWSNNVHVDLPQLMLHWRCSSPPLIFALDTGSMPERPKVPEVNSQW